MTLRVNKTSLNKLPSISCDSLLTFTTVLHYVSFVLQLTLTLFLLLIRVTFICSPNLDRRTPKFILTITNTPKIGLWNIGVVRWEVGRKIKKYHTQTVKECDFNKRRHSSLRNPVRLEERCRRTCVPDGFLTGTLCKPSFPTLMS